MKVVRRPLFAWLPVTAGVATYAFAFAIPVWRPADGSSPTLVFATVALIFWVLGWDSAIRYTATHLSITNLLVTSTVTWQDVSRVSMEGGLHIELRDGRELGSIAFGTTARANWFALLDAMGAGEVVDRLCPGKVLLLVAADVAAWHRMSGGGLHPDTGVWTELPLPWQVLRGEAECPRSLVEEVCRRHGVDPVKGGWTEPRRSVRAAPFRPTPELVHGVQVGDPLLAGVLRSAGFFSGQPLRPAARELAPRADV